MTKRNRAFTLVELLVVIGIIAILIAVLLPALNRARASASSVKCQANLRSLGQAVAIYVAQNKGVMPYGWYDGFWESPTGAPIAPPGGQAAHSVKWPALLMSTLSSKYGMTWIESRTTGSDSARLRAMFFCPEIPSEDAIDNAQANTHYTCHPRLMPVVGPNNGFDPMPPFLTIRSRCYKFGGIKRPSEVALMFDGSVGFNKDTNRHVLIYDMPIAANIGNGAYKARTFLLDTFYNRPSPPLNPHDSVDMSPGNSRMDYILSGTTTSVYTILAAAPNATQNIKFRHMNKTVLNALMVDGHVESFTYNNKLPPSHLRVSTLMWKHIHVNPN
jgi:prepilin-type N-terminal cleavage/methylation domain-containing protein/prepilin-type processing-associated H-X9-DG protein